MNKSPAGPAQSNKSSKRVLSFIYLFKSRRSAGAYLFIQNQTISRPSFFIFSFFSFFWNAEIAHLFIQNRVDFPALIFSFFIFLIFPARGNRSFIYSKTSRFSGIHFVIFSFFSFSWPQGWPLNE